jgi:hypothetical protein
VKSEYLTLATVFGTAGLAYAATSVGKKKTAPGNTPLDQGKDAVPLNAGSRLVQFSLVKMERPKLTTG